MTIATIADRVHGALRTRHTDCPMEEVVGLCPDLTWNQVFMGIDHLSRTGRIRVSMNRRRAYVVKILQSAR